MSAEPESTETGGGTEIEVSPRADFISAFFWIAFGLAVAIASWRMDRLESQGATPYTAPGLVPGILGTILILLGVLLAVRAARAGGHRLGATPWLPSASGRAAMARAGWVLVMGLVYAAGMVGHAGIPFWLATFVFVTLFILLFDLRARAAKDETVKGIVLAIAVGAGTAFLVSYVFQELFLVRLP
ncbi:MAG: tripartite tricarboxylate transporter TctB family protein [Burkholderiales bacterium]|nr:tripartite tricarboxylate transporter TctB family protein [Burkholderiales bacterium]